MNNQNIERVTDGGDHAHDKQAMIPMGQAGPSQGTEKGQQWSRHRSEKHAFNDNVYREASADHAGSSNTQKSKKLGEQILEIVQLVWHIVDLSLIALDILPGAINGTLKLIAQSASSKILEEDIVAKMLDQHVKKMKPKSVVKRLEKKFLGDDQIKSIQLCGEMIDDIEKQLKTVFGQSLFNMETKTEAYLVKTKLIFFYRRLYRKLFGLLEAPYDGNGVEKFKIMPKKSEKEALLIWLHGAMKYLSMELNSSLKKFTDLDRAQMLQIFTKFDQIETCKERMNLAFFVVDFWELKFENGLLRNNI
uniref:NR LBD domain-containing protein n=1 Tax=Globodera pallida TaxID=36090 RepID=A0A183BM44_GLOPA